MRHKEKNRNNKQQRTRRNNNYDANSHIESQRAFHESQQKSEESEKTKSSQQRRNTSSNNRRNNYRKNQRNNNRSNNRKHHSYSKDRKSNQENQKVSATNNPSPITGEPVIYNTLTGQIVEFEKSSAFLQSKSSSNMVESVGQQVNLLKKISSRVSSIFTKK